MFRVQAVDSELSLVTKSGAIPYADLLPDTVKSLQPDSSNGEFVTRQQACCALFLDDVAESLLVATTRKTALKKKKIDASLYAGAIHPVDNKLYDKYGTPRSTMSGCNPSRHALAGSEFIRPFDGAEYEDILSEYGTPMGTHVHMNLSLAEAKRAGMNATGNGLYDSHLFDNKKMSKFVQECIVAFMIPTLYALKGAGDDEGIRTRFKLLPPGYFRVKQYGIEFKDFPSTVLRHPAYMAAAFMAARNAPCIGKIKGMKLREAFDAIANVDRDYIDKWFPVIHGLIKDASFGSLSNWRSVANHKPSSIEESWQIPGNFTKDGKSIETHRLGLITSAWDFDNRK